MWSYTKYSWPSLFSCTAFSTVLSETRWPAETREVERSASTDSATCRALHCCWGVRRSTPDEGPTYPKLKNGVRVCTLNKIPYPNRAQPAGSDSPTMVTFRAFKSFTTSLTCYPNLQGDHIHHALLTKPQSRSRSCSLSSKYGQKARFTCSQVRTDTVTVMASFRSVRLATILWRASTDRGAAEE